MYVCNHLFLSCTFQLHATPNESRRPLIFLRLVHIPKFCPHPAIFCKSKPCGALPSKQVLLPIVPDKRKQARAGQTNTRPIHITQRKQKDAMHDLGVLPPSSPPLPEKASASSSHSPSSPASFPHPRLMLVTHWCYWYPRNKAAQTRQRCRISSHHVYICTAKGRAFYAF